MPDLQFERLEYVQLRDHEAGIEFDILSAEMGDGYVESAIVGDTRGLRSWSITYGHLPRAPHRRTGRFSTESVEAYLWDFFVRHMSAGNAPFIVRDPRTKKDFLVGFTETRLGYRALLDRFYTTGIAVKQRRVKGVNTLEDGSLGESTTPDAI